MKNPSLAAASISNRLAERTTHNIGRYEHPAMNMAFTGRYCTIKGERSGGYVLTATLSEKYDHDRPNKLQKRLKPGYTHKQKLRAIQRLIDALAEQRTMMRHRELVYKTAESHDLPLDRIDQIAEAENRTIVYAEMTIADCEFWMVELCKFPPKKAA